MANERKQIGNTPLSIGVYSVESTSTRIHDKGMLEIIFCLKGSVKFTYGYEEFTLHQGEYISVDKDAYYLYDGKDNICVSLYFDLNRYADEYPFICNNLFVCEGLAETSVEYTAQQHRDLKGMLIALLKCISDNGDEGKIAKGVDKIVDMFVESFDLLFFYAGGNTLPKEVLVRNHSITDYIYDHIKEPITVRELAKELGFTPGYMSEYMRKYSIGFRNMIGYIRANESEHMLINTQKTILDISEECGFSDVKYYYSAFKKWYKCTPGEFRKKYVEATKDKITYVDFRDIEGILNEMLTEHFMDLFLPAN